MPHRKASTRNLEIYGITGRKYHGKDTFAKLICMPWGRLQSSRFDIISFAHALKHMTGRVFGIPDTFMYDSVLKEKQFDTPIYIDNFLSEMSKETGLDIQPKNKIAYNTRQLLQYFGTDYVRSIQDTFWIDRLMNSSNLAKCLISDVRFVNEAQIIKARGGIIIKIIRLDYKSEAHHISEKEIDDINPDLLLAFKEGDLSLAKRVALLIAMNRYSWAKSYDYRLVTEILKSYDELKSIERVYQLLKHNNKPSTYYILQQLIDYYYAKPRRKYGPGKTQHRFLSGKEEKYCGNCQEWKSLDSFNNNTRTWDLLNAHCRVCQSHQHKERYNKYSRADSIKRIFEQTKRSAKFRGLEFSIQLDELYKLWDEQDGKCKYSGLEMTLIPKDSLKVTIDRIDSDKGYVVGNIVLCGYRINIMKGNMNLCEFKKMINALYINIGATCNSYGRLI